MLLYIDPSTGPVIFTGLAAFFTAIGSGLIVFLALLLRPVRMFFSRIWHIFFKGKKSDTDEHDNP